MYGTSKVRRIKAGVKELQAPFKSTKIHTGLLESYLSYIHDTAEYRKYFSLRINLEM